MRKQNFMLLLVTVTLVVLLFGCMQNPGTDSSQIPTSPQISPIKSDIQRQSSPEVLKACPVEKQALAMRNDLMPDWNHLGLFACYNLTLDLTDPEKPFSASETLVMTNQETTPMNEIVFRIFPNAKNIYGGKITVIDAIANQKSLQTEIFLSDLSALRVLLDQPLLPDETISVKLNYTIEPSELNDSQDSYGIFTKSDTETIVTLANWFPILATRQNGQWLASSVLHGGDAVTSNSALFQVSVTVPPSWQVASTGKEIAKVETGANIRLDFVSGPVRDFMISASPNFLMQKHQVGDILITQFGIESTYGKWEHAWSTARSAFDYYQKTYGSYPFNEIDIVAVPLKNISGVEYPGLILITNNAYQPGSREGLLEVVIAHELAHQWWYSIIGNDVTANPWQDEGLTTYSTLDYFRSISSPIFTFLLNDYRDRVALYEKDYPGEAITQPVSAFQGRETAYSLLVYSKAALFFENIRTRIGQAKMDAALKQYYLSNQFLLVQPEVLAESIWLNCQCDLSDLFKEYGASQFIP